MTYALIAASSLLSANTAFANNDQATAELQKQREMYTRAQDARKKRDHRQYQQLKSQLTQYPLYPYLEYADLSKIVEQYTANKKAGKRTSSTALKKARPEIDQFLNTHTSSYLGVRLLRKWLNYLAISQNWQDYKRYYQPYVKKTELACYHLQALIETNTSFPDQAIQELWLTKKSQPDECDPIFEQWQRKGYLTQDLLWERHRLAVNAKHYGLASYLHRKMNASNRYLADLYTKIHKTPARIKNARELSAPPKHTDNSTRNKLIDIAYNGLYRYAYKEPLAAFKLYTKLDASYQFAGDETQKFYSRVASRLLSKDDINEAVRILNQSPQEHEGKIVEKLLRKFLAQQQWADIHHWISKLPIEDYKSDRWRYWKARAQEEIVKTNRTQKFAENTETIFRELAASRSFHGFLAADKLKTDYQFVDKPSPVDLDTIKTVRKFPGMVRAKELFSINEMYKARTEWRYSVRSFSEKEFLAAGQLAHLWGWNRKAIEAMAGAAYWDDLTIRFPIVHDDIVHKKAQKNNVPSSLIFSIARQESAWEFDAKSRVGARGLMQIMPATAKETAKKANIRYRKHKLFDPEYNITLGSYYISSLLKQYDNNRALAIASYNAGPHRVKQWLARSEASLPIDVWIEIIPFKETRKYVQNVLSYEVIYNYRQGKESSLLTLAEAKAIL